MKLPRYLLIPRLVTLYRRVSFRWPSASRTFQIYRTLHDEVAASLNHKRR